MLEPVSVYPVEVLLTCASCLGLLLLLAVLFWFFCIKLPLDDNTMDYEDDDN